MRWKVQRFALPHDVCDLCRHRLRGISRVTKYPVASSVEQSAVDRRVDRWASSTRQLCELRPVDEYRKSDNCPEEDEER